ncbi:MULTISPECIES: CHAT domain-containing protein [Actinoplanes]|uniref:CHAT domain-containing protein n=1 Tax=Actinoplanes TaxID=1865 RepID=UPI0005F28585|nr:MULTISPECIES: CHAT domain-containing protein [Actinoplanes]GLY00509.1 CHAT domain-containing protein [Actinoplanes sp. NBRC 101535]
MRPDTPDPERLLPLALARPRQAYAEATRLLDGGPGPYTASIAHQVRAIVVRDHGDHVRAVRELRRAVRLAGRSGDPERLADVRATLGLTLGLAGRTREGLDLLNVALDGRRGASAGRILARRAGLLRSCGRLTEALADLRRAIVLLGRAGDAVWEARCRSHRFLIYAAVGQAARADRDLVIAERLFVAAGQDLEHAMTVHNRAELAFQVGDLPRALGLLDEAQSRYDALRANRPTLPTDRCHVLLAAGLAGEALTVTDQALARHVARGGEATRTAELMLAVAAAAQAAGRPEVAAHRAAQARALFRRQHRRAWQNRAAFVELQALADTTAGFGLGTTDGSGAGTAAVTVAGTVAGADAGTASGAAGTAGLRRRAIALADELTASRAPEAGAADLLAARLCTPGGAAADRHLARAARARHRGPGLTRAAGWLAQALRAEARGSARGLLTACRLGLEAVAEHQRGLAAPDLRAHASGYGRRLAAMAQRHAVLRGDARMLLTWSERWRAGALALPPVRPPSDPDLAADLAALRGVIRSLEQARLAEDPVDQLDQRRRKLEASVRSRARRVPGGTTGGGPGRMRIGDLLDGLAGHRLIGLAVVDGRIHATTVAGRRVRAFPAGTLDAAMREAELARFLLRRLAHGLPSPRWREELATAGARLQELLLGAAAGLLDDGPTVIVPPARFHTVPWSLLPALTGVPVVVSPSALMWLRAGAAEEPGTGAAVSNAGAASSVAGASLSNAGAIAGRAGERRVVVAGGPGLPGGAGEVAAVAREHPGAVVLDGPAATVDAVLAALDGAWLAHIAAHGRFRADNPLFTSVTLADGPLTAYDLGRLRRAPRQLVLSSCDSAVAAPVGGDELLGMVSALAPLGTTGLLASVVPVNDGAACPMMVIVHRRLAVGESFGEALCAARAAARATGDPVAIATAASFIAVGR